MLDENDIQIMRLRALGLHQEEIANKIGMSQSAVSQRIKIIRDLDINVEIIIREKIKNTTYTLH